MEEILNVTMKRLEIIMKDAKLALENRAENLISAAILILENYERIEKVKKTQYWEMLYGYAKELYIQTVVHIPVTGERDQYLQSCEIVKEMLVCKECLMTH